METVFQVFETVSQVFGFTSSYTTLWNLLGYIAFLAAIAGVLIEKPRLLLFFLASVAFGIYAYVFLGNMLFAILHGVIAISAFLQFVKVRQGYAKNILSVSVVAAWLLAFYGGYLITLVDAACFAGLLFIAYGITVLSRPAAFLWIAAGGTLVAFYALKNEMWVLFFLNLFFTLASIYSYNEAKKVKTT